MCNKRMQSILNIKYKKYLPQVAALELHAAVSRQTKTSFPLRLEPRLHVYLATVVSPFVVILTFPLAGSYRAGQETKQPIHINKF